MSSTVNTPQSTGCMRPTSVPPPPNAGGTTLSPVTNSGSGDTISITNPKSDSKEGFWDRLRNVFSSEKSASNPSSEKGKLERLQNWLFKTKDDNGKEVSSWLGKCKESLSKFFNGSETHSLGKRIV